MKRNWLVLAAIVVVIWCVVVAGVHNLRRRRLAAMHHTPQVILVPDNGNTTATGPMTASSPAAQDEDTMPNFRGKTAPAFKLKSVDGKPVSLADYKGKAVLVNFWATWCAPCKVETPWLAELHTKYAPQGFEILGIATDDDKKPAEVAESARKLGMNYPVLMGDDAASKAYGDIQYLPSSYFVGRDGKVVEQSFGLVSKDELDAAIRKSLEAPKS